MQILEVNHEEYVDGLDTFPLSEAIVAYVNQEMSTEEFWGVAADHAPESGLESWKGAEDYGLKPQATFAFDGCKGRLFETSEGYVFDYFAN